jgi:diguanylate cyclase (GGDEF)-like protein
VRYSESDQALLAFVSSQVASAIERQRAQLARLQQSERIQKLAFYDALTGLPNRALFHDRLRHALGSAERTGRNVALLFLDLDRFKEINDTFGHQVGDSALQRIAALLRESLRASDLAGRMGGDEFAAYLVEADEETGARLLARLNDRVDELIASGELPAACTFSAGLATFPSEATDADALFRLADSRLYESKRASAD